MSVEVTPSTCGETPTIYSGVNKKLFKDGSFSTTLKKMKKRRRRKKTLCAGEDKLLSLLDQSIEIKLLELSASEASVSEADDERTFNVDNPLS